MFFVLGLKPLTMKTIAKNNGKPMINFGKQKSDQEMNIRSFGVFFFYSRFRGQELQTIAKTKTCIFNVSKCVCVCFFGWWRGGGRGGGRGGRFGLSKLLIVKERFLDFCKAFTVRTCFSSLIHINVYTDI